MKISYLNLGCPKNQVDLEQILGGLSDSIEITTDVDEAQAVIINTCAFIRSAKEESVDAILEIAQLKESSIPKKVLVTGCLPQRYQSELQESLPEVDRFFTSSDPLQVSRDIRKFLRLGAQPQRNRNLLSPSHYAYLKIADGCDNRCSYCAIPLIKGAYKSRSLQEVVDEAELLVETGVREIIIVAQDTTHYGQDLQNKTSISNLLEALNSISKLQWIRLLYTHPRHWSDELVESIAGLDKVCKYVDVPIQHVSNRLLKLMGRKVTRENIKALITKLRVGIPNVAIRTSVIVGFPGETDNEFRGLLSFIQEMNFERLGVFTYSQEDSTAAGRLQDDIEQSVKEERASLIMEAQSRISYKKNRSLIGENQRVLIDRYDADNNRYVGRTQWDAPEIDNAVIIADKVEVGGFYNVKIMRAEPYDVHAHLIGFAPIEQQPSDSVC